MSSQPEMMTGAALSDAGTPVALSVLADSPEVSLPVSVGKM